MENESDRPKAFLQVPTAGRRELRLLPQQASQPGLAFLGPCPPITRASLSSPRHSALCHLHGPGAGELSLCPLPVTTGASVPPSTSPGGAALGPWFGDLGGTPGPQVGTRWNSQREDNIAHRAQGQGLGTPPPHSAAVKHQHPECSDPAQWCRHLAEPAALARGQGLGTETLQHVLAPVLCLALAFLFREQRPGGPCRTEKG